MKVLLILIILSITSLNIIKSDDDFSSKTYLTLSANQKMDKLWAKISENQTSLGFYSKFDLLKMFFMDMWVSFQEPGDVLPAGRKKLIHTVGNIAKAEFIPEAGSPYTGVFRGSKNLLIRLSLATDQDTSKKSAQGASQNFKPGMALKFLRDGLPAGNVVAMFSTEGQDSWNFFKNDFTNIFALMEDAPAASKAIAAKFTTVTNNISSVGVLDLAKFKENGEEEAKPVFPFKLIFRPTSEVNTLFSDGFQETYTVQLGKVPSDATIYDVYAIDEPGCNEFKMGSIKLTTGLITSHFGDEKLFFRHGLIDDDDKIKGFTAYRDYYHALGGLTPAAIPAKKTGCPVMQMLKHLK